MGGRCSPLYNFCLTDNFNINPHKIKLKIKKQVIFQKEAAEGSFEAIEAVIFEAIDLIGKFYSEQIYINHNGKLIFACRGRWQSSRRAAVISGSLPSATAIYLLTCHCDLYKD